MSNATTNMRQLRPFVAAPGWLCMVGSTEDDGWDDMEIASLETGKPIKISATGITFKSMSQICCFT